MLISHTKKRSKDKAAAAYSPKGAEGKGKEGRSWMSKGSCSKGGQCLFEHDTAKKKAEGIDQEVRFKETSQQNDNMPEQQRKRPSGKEDRPPCFNCNKGIL